MNGQSVFSMVGDIAFFAAVTILGIHGVLKETTLSVIVISYANWRFSVAMSKQQTATALAASSGGGGGGPASGGGSGSMRAVVEETRVPPPAVTPKRDPRTFRVMLRELTAWFFGKAVVFRPADLFLVPLLALLLLFLSR